MTDRSKRSPITATELMGELRNDPEYQRRFQEAEAERQSREQALRRAERPLLADLEGVGIRVDSVWHLNTSDPDLNALPVLMDHFEKGGYPERVMEGIGSALAVRPSVSFWDRLKARWLEARGPGEEEGAAVALAACATKEQIEDLISFLSVEKRGMSRIYFVRPILKVGGQRGRAIIESLRDDPVFGKEATALLKRRRK